MRTTWFGGRYTSTMSSLPKTPAGGFPVPISPPAPPSPPPMYLSRNLTWRKPAKPPQPAAPTGGSPQPAAPVAEPAQPATSSHPVSPPPSRPTTRSSANQNSAPRSEPRSPPTPGRANENSRLNPPLRRSERLKTAAHRINRPAQATPAHSSHTINMARTYPYSLTYDTCLGPTEDSFSFSSVYIEELHSGQRTYVKHVQQIVDLLPRTLDPSSRYTLRAHVTPPGHQRMRDSLRLALWWFLPRDGNFRRAADGLHYYLARQGRRVVLRGGNVTSPLHESRLLWVHDPHPRQSTRVPSSHPPASQKNNAAPRTNDTVPRTNDTVPRTNDTVPRTNYPVPRNIYQPPQQRENVPKNNPIVSSSDARVRVSLGSISSSVWHNSSLSSRSDNCPPVPRNNVTDRQTSDRDAVHPPPKRKRNRIHRRERRARERAELSERAERAEIEEAFIHDAQWATQSSGALSSTIVPDRLTTLGLPHSDPISAMRPAVYPPVTLEGRPSTNENSSFQFGQELGESAGLLPGLYKPAVPDPQHDTWISSFRAYSSEEGPPSPPRTSRAHSSSSRPRTGIVFPLQPRQHRPDTYIDVEAAALPEPAALQRDDPLPSRGVPTDLTRPAQRPARKRRRKRSSALYRPAKRSPPWGRWCII